MATISTSPDFSDNDFAKYATLEDLQNAILAFSQVNLTSLTKDEITYVVGSYFGTIPLLHGFFGPEKFNKFLLYRVRRKVDKTKEDLNLLQTYSFPLPQFCTENGRGNLKNKSVFYCSNSAWTAIRESKPEKGEIAYLSIWQGSTMRPLKAGVLLPKVLHPANEWHGLAEEIRKYSQEHFGAQLKHKAAFFEELIDFIAERFLKEESPYPFTSWVSDLMLYGSSGKDFMVYPSFIDDAYSCNLAFHPNVAQTALKFAKTIRIQVQETKDTFAVGMGHVGELINNNIIWRKPNSDEQDLNNFSMIV